MLTLRGLVILSAVVATLAAVTAAYLFISSASGGPGSFARQEPLSVFAIVPGVWIVSFAAFFLAGLNYVNQRK